MEQPINVLSYNVLIWNRNIFHFLTNNFFCEWIFSNVDIFKNGFFKRWIFLSGQFQAWTFSNEYVDNFKEVDIAQHEDIGF